MSRAVPALEPIPKDGIRNIARKKWSVALRKPREDRGRGGKVKEDTNAKEEKEKQKINSAQLSNESNLRFVRSD